jgi:hypothetical protein
MIWLFLGYDERQKFPHNLGSKNKEILFLAENNLHISDNNRADQNAGYYIVSFGR